MTVCVVTSAKSGSLEVEGVAASQPAPWIAAAARHNSCLAMAHDLLRRKRGAKDLCCRSATHTPVGLSRTLTCTGGHGCLGNSIVRAKRLVYKQVHIRGGAWLPTSK